MSSPDYADSAWLTPTEAGHRLGVSRSRIIQLCNDGRLACERTALGRLISTSAVDALIEERSDAT